MLETVKADSFCNLLQTLAISFTLRSGNRLHIQLRVRSLPYRAYTLAPGAALSRLILFATGCINLQPFPSLEGVASGVPVRTIGNYFLRFQVG